MFGLFGNKNKKNPEAAKKASPVNNVKETPAPVKTAPTTVNQSQNSTSKATPSNTTQDYTRPGPNGCADICTREE